MCQNDQINGKCSNLDVGEVKFILKLLLHMFLTVTIIVQKICLGRQGEDCRETYVVQWPDTGYTIAQKFHIPYDVFMDNNYCYYTGAGRGRNCPAYNDGTVSFWIGF